MCVRAEKIRILIIIKSAVLGRFSRFANVYTHTRAHIYIVCGGGDAITVTLNPYFPAKPFLGNSSKRVNALYIRYCPQKKRRTYKRRDKEIIPGRLFSKRLVRGIRRTGEREYERDR